MSNELVEKIIEDYEEMISILQNRVKELRGLGLEGHQAKVADVHLLPNTGSNDIRNSIAAERKRILDSVTAYKNQVVGSLPSMPSTGIGAGGMVPGEPGVSGNFRMPSVPGLSEEQRAELEEKISVANKADGKEG